MCRVFLNGNVLPSGLFLMPGWRLNLAQQAGVSPNPPHGQWGDHLHDRTMWWGAARLGGSLTDAVIHRSPALSLNDTNIEHRGYYRGGSLKRRVGSVNWTKTRPLLPPPPSTNAALMQHVQQHPYWHACCCRVRYVSPQQPWPQTLILTRKVVQASICCSAL